MFENIKNPIEQVILQENLKESFIEPKDNIEDYVEIKTKKAGRPKMTEEEKRLSKLKRVLKKLQEENI